MRLLISKIPFFLISLQLFKVFPKFWPINLSLNRSKIKTFLQNICFSSRIVLSEFLSCPSGIALLFLLLSNAGVSRNFISVLSKLFCNSSKHNSVMSEQNCHFILLLSNAGVSRNFTSVLSKLFCNSSKVSSIYISCAKNRSASSPLLTYSVEFCAKDVSVHILLKWEMYQCIFCLCERCISAYSACVRDVSVHILLVWEMYHYIFYLCESCISAYSPCVRDVSVHILLVWEMYQYIFCLRERCISTYSACVRNASLHILFVWEVYQCIFCLCERCISTYSTCVRDVCISAYSR